MKQLDQRVSKVCSVTFSVLFPPFLSNYVLSPFPEVSTVWYLPVPPVSRVQGRGGAAGPGKGRTQGGVLNWKVGKRKLAQSGERTEQELSPSVPTSIGGYSHGPPHGKRPTLPLSLILLPFLTITDTATGQRGRPSCHAGDGYCRIGGRKPLEPQAWAQREEQW